MSGQFRFWMPRPTRDLVGWTPELLGLHNSIVVPNLNPNEGEIEMLKMIFQASVAVVSSGGNFYVGLCDQTPVKTDDLTDISTEPTSAGGYARKAVTRDGTGWPTLTTINGRNAIRSASVTFSASGADFSRDISRAFLTSVASGTSGTLFAYSGALTVPVTVPNGESFPMVYEFLMG